MTKKTLYSSWTSETVDTVVTAWRLRVLQSSAARQWQLYTSSALIASPFTHILIAPWCTRWRSWLRHCATSRKVAGSIPDGVNGIFHWHNPSGRTMVDPFSNRVLGMFPKGGRSVELTTLPPSYADSWNLGVLTFWNPQGLSRNCFAFYCLPLAT